MKNTAQKRADNLRRIIEDDYRGSQTLFAERIGISLSQIGQWLAAPDSPYIRNMGERSARKIEKILNLDEGALDCDNGDRETIGSLLKPFDERLVIPIKNVSAAMGDGYISPDFELVVDTMTVNRSWLKSELPQITAPSNLQLITAVGDSMQPTFESGNLLLVDTGIKTIHSDLIYAFSYKGETYVKRIFLDPVASLLYVKSDNPSASNWQPIDVNSIDDFIIHGRVIYSWKGNKM